VSYLSAAVAALSVRRDQYLQLPAVCQRELKDAHHVLDVLLSLHLE